MPMSFYEPAGDPGDPGDQYNDQKNQAKQLGDKNTERKIEIGPKSANNKDKEANTSTHNDDDNEDEDRSIIKFVYNTDDEATQGNWSHPNNID